MFDSCPELLSMIAVYVRQKTRRPSIVANSTPKVMMNVSAGRRRHHSAVSVTPSTQRDPPGLSCG